MIGYVEEEPCRPMIEPLVLIVCRWLLGQVSAFMWQDGQGMVDYVVDLCGGWSLTVAQGANNHMVAECGHIRQENPQDSDCNGAV